MTCPKCKSDNVTVQAVGITKTKKKGCMYWLFIGWWWDTILWFFLTIPMLIFKMFGKSKIKTTVKSFAVCQNCGYQWNV